MEHQVITSTKKTAFVLVSLLAATGVAGVELGQAIAQADQPNVMSADAAYAGARVDTAFDLVAALPAEPTVMIPMAMKGDLPIPRGCLGVSDDAQAECMDVAYEVPAEPSIVVETHEGTTTTLMRMDAMTLAGMATETLLESE
jgi:hypothetical protein